jgi:hypothetical protein
MLDNANRPDVQAMQDRKLVYKYYKTFRQVAFFDGALDKIIDENINMQELCHFKSYVNLGLYTIPMRFMLIIIMIVLVKLYFIM